MPHFNETNFGLLSNGESPSLEPIAIVGMACRTAGKIDSPSSLWDSLKANKSSLTPKVPSSRFNIDAFLHENLDRPGSFNVPGGYFLDENPEDFDPTFFKIPPVEAMWLDPQQRKMLEVTYECLESAGLSLEAVRGSNTAVIIGSFTSDYRGMSMWDGDFGHKYSATGADTGLISTRIGNIFDLTGPSFTLNTACSSSIYAVHNACNALRARDCDAAIAGGVNLILSPDHHMYTAKIGTLSPTSTCHSFDASADGYGRADGISAIYLKRLSDAIRDGNPIRGVIRSSAINTNGRVPGASIAHPSVEAQEKVVRMAYERSGLNAVNTAYVECHGTGTRVGDPIETRAISNAMNDNRSKDKPLLIGSIKSNIGHSEAASGIFAIIKAALMTEEALIPGVAGFRTLNPNILEEDWNIKVNVHNRTWPDGFAERRVGVSSFGYSGTNGHIIIENVDGLYPKYAHGRKRGMEPVKSVRPFLLPFSAHEEKTLKRNIAAHAQVVPEYHLADIAYTLATRSRMGARGFTVTEEPTSSAKLDLSKFTIGQAPLEEPNLAFIFTGQGAQWPGLGQEAIAAFPLFAATIKALDLVLQRLSEKLRPSWTIESVLMRFASAPDINDADIAQPVCTAIQIAIVDLFASWGISPAATIGHSSGEIAAAYCAGLISAPEAIIVAYLRGVAIKRYAPPGSMLAVGIDLDTLDKYKNVWDGKLSIACRNSPESLTLSGTPDAITRAKVVLSADGLFARELKVEKAYHSPQMEKSSTAYDDMMNISLCQLSAEDTGWKPHRVRWFSSVTGNEHLDNNVETLYWSENLRSPVLFDKAISEMLAASGLKNSAIFIEVGPHAALATPFAQICAAAKTNNAYIASLVRNRDSAKELLRAAGSLFIQNYPLDLSEINSIETDRSVVRLPKHRRCSLLVDLPPYQWTYDKSYWVEPRLSLEHRNRKHARHDLLGSRFVGLSGRSLAWRNILRHSDVSWLKDHTLGGNAILPAAGHLSMAGEAIRQVYEDQGFKVESLTFRDVDLLAALIIPDRDDGIETQFRLTQEQDDDLWFKFSIESLVDGKWILNSKGLIAANHLKREPRTSAHPVNPQLMNQCNSGNVWYRAFRRVGFQYGPSFQPLNNVLTHAKHRCAVGDIKIDTKSGLMVGESRYLLHPTAIDGCLQLIIVSINSGKHKEMTCGVIPTRIEELSIWAFDIQAHVGKSVAWTDVTDGRHFNTHSKLFAENGELLMDVSNLRCITYEAAVPQSEHFDRPREPYAEMIWRTESTTESSTHKNHSMNSLSPQHSIIVLHADKLCPRSSSDLVCMLQECGSSAESMHLLEHQPPSNRSDVTYIIDDSAGDLLLNLDEHRFQSLKAVLTNGSPIVYLTRGLHQGSCVNASLSLGLLRVIRSEQAAAQILHFDADPTEPIASVVKAIHDKGGRIPTKDSEQNIEYWLHNGTLYSPKIVPNQVLNSTESSDSAKAHKVVLKQATRFSGRIFDDRLVFETATAEGTEVGAHDVTIQVEIASLNHQEPRKTLTGLTVVTGSIISTGHALDASLVGQTAVAHATSPYKTTVTTSQFHVVAHSGAQIPAITASIAKFADSVHAVVEMGNIQKGQSLLILPTSQRFVEAVAGLQQALQFQLKVVVKSQHEMHELASATRLHSENFVLSSDLDKIKALLKVGNVDLVVSSDFHSFSREIWRHMPPESRFVLRDSALETRPDLAPFARGVSFSISRIEDLIARRPAALTNLLTRTLTLVEQYSLLREPSILDVGYVCEERISAAIPLPDPVIKYHYGQSIIKVAPTPKLMKFSPNAAYFLVGCLGGLGRSLVSFMLERGARDFVFLSRSGADKREATQLVDSIREAGASVQILRGDVASKGDVEHAIQTVTATRPIKGVVHAAMVLQDSSFDEMTLEQFRAAMKPKVCGAKNLDEGFENIQLDFFVMTSSISAIAGNAGQANYAAANSYLDAVAWSRTIRGLPATSLVLPAVMDVGIVAHNAMLEESLFRKGIYGIDEQELLRGFEVAMLSYPRARSAPVHGDAQIILGCEPSVLADTMTASTGSIDETDWYRDARFSHIRKEVETINASSQIKMFSAQGSFAQKLGEARTCGVEAILDFFELQLAEKLASMLLMPVESFLHENRKPITHFGIDSQMSILFRNWLFKQFGLEISFPAFLARSTTIAALAHAIAELQGLISRDTI